MTINEWRSNNQNVKEAMRLHELSGFTDLIDMLEDSAPMNLACVPTGNPHTDSRYLGIVEGYHQCLKNIRNAAKKADKVKQVEAAYETPI